MSAFAAPLGRGAALGLNARSYDAALPSTSPTIGACGDLVGTWNTAATDVRTARLLDRHQGARRIVNALGKCLTDGEDVDLAAVVREIAPRLRLMRMPRADLVDIASRRACHSNERAGRQALWADAAIVLWHPVGRRISRSWGWT
jgi:hypothetical protein